MTGHDWTPVPPVAVTTPGLDVPAKAAKGGHPAPRRKSAPLSTGQESQTLPSVRPHLGCEPLPCGRADREHRAATIGGVPEHDHPSPVTDLDAPAAVGSAVRGLPPSAVVTCCLHIIATSAMNSSDRDREYASSLRSPNMVVA
jgi:hypothetical protein